MHAISPNGTELLDKTEDVTVSFDAQESIPKDPADGYQGIVMLQPPINKCPPEVLSMIFRLAIHQAPTHVRRLLLVCRSWCTLVTQDPLMWSTIKLTLHPDPWKLRWWVRRHLLFAKRCLERSRSTLLDITLNLGSLQSIDEQQQEKRRIDNEHSRFSGSKPTKTYPHYWLNYDSWSDEEEYWDERSWGSENGWDEQKPVYHERDPERHSAPEHVFDLLKEITGPEGKLMERWQSLDLIFPRGDDMAYGVWNMISYPLPNLSRLRLDMNLPIYEERDEFESLYLVESLQFTINEVNNWGFLTLLPPSLQDLSISTNLETSFLCQLSRLTRLRSLTLLPAMEVIDCSGASPLPPQRVELPLLQTFRIEALLEHMPTVEFSFPALEDQVFMLQCEDQEWLEFPMVEQVPISVHWESREFPNASAMISAKALMRRILLHFDGAQYLFVPAFAKDAFSDLLREMLSGGSLPRSWKMASFCDTEGSKETVDIANLSAKE